MIQKIDYKLPINEVKLMLSKLYKIIFIFRRDTKKEGQLTFKN